MKTIVEYINDKEIVEIEALKKWHKKTYGKSITAHKISNIVKTQGIFPLYSFYGGKLVGYAVYDAVKNVEGIRVERSRISTTVQAMHAINRITKGSFNKYKPFYYKETRKLKIEKLRKDKLLDGILLEIMKYIWSKGKEVTAKECYEKLNKKHGGSRQDYSVYLFRLYIRGFLTRRKVKCFGGHKFIYTAKITQKEYQGIAVKELVRI